MTTLVIYFCLIVSVNKELSNQHRSPNAHFQLLNKGDRNENKEGKDLLKKWYSEYSPNSEEMSVADRPPGHGLGDVNVATGVGAGYGVGSVSYRQDFGFGMGLSGRSGGQRYGFGSDLMPHLNG